MIDKPHTAVRTETSAAAAGVAGAITANEHFVRFFVDDETLVDSVAAYVIQGLREGATAIVIATDAHLKALETRWPRLQFDPTEPTAQGRLMILDAVQTLSSLMVAGKPDRDRFMASVGEIVARTAGRAGRILAFGEMVNILWADGNRTAAVELES